MAQARKCDRCGVLYEHDKNVNSILLTETVADGDIHYALKEYDLCPDCMKRLLHWLNDKAKLEGAE